MKNVLIFLLAIMAFIVFNGAISATNPCSNFSNDHYRCSSDGKR